MKTSRLSARRVTTLYVVALIPAIVAAMIAVSPGTAASKGKMIEIVLDASGSMKGRLPSGTPKILAAKRAVENLIRRLPGDIIVAFRAYGHQSYTRQKNCKDTQLLVNFGPLSKNAKQIIAKAKALDARGYTPITYVLTLAAKDFPPKYKARKIIILVSDGKETCKGDPCALALALKKADAKLVIHTIGFGVYAPARDQLRCIAKATGGKYFPANSARQLSQMLQKAVKARSVQTPGLKPLPKKVTGYLKIVGAGIRGHWVYNAQTGKKAAMITGVNAIAKLPAGIYYVVFGRAKWKSVRVELGKMTVLRPSRLVVMGASVSGNNIRDAETGTVHAWVTGINNSATLMPGEYVVDFGKVQWRVKLPAGKTVVLKPGIVVVKHPAVSGHNIYTKEGKRLGYVSGVMNWMPLPPGDYIIEIKRGQKIKFTLKAGEKKEF